MALSRNEKINQEWEHRRRVRRVEKWALMAFTVPAIVTVLVGAFYIAQWWLG